jgi:hypothetical protein
MDLLDATNTVKVGSTPAPARTRSIANAVNARSRQYATLNGFGSSIAEPSRVSQCSSWSPVTQRRRDGPSATGSCYYAGHHHPTTSPLFAGCRAVKASKVPKIAVCGVRICCADPILVLDPNSPHANPNQASLNIQGNCTIAIFGGPSRSIQANSSASSGSCGQSNCTLNLPWGSAQIDLSHGGHEDTGSEIGVTGAPTAPPGGSGVLPDTGLHRQPPLWIRSPRFVIRGRRLHCNH